MTWARQAPAREVRRVARQGSAEEAAERGGRAFIRLPTEANGSTPRAAASPVSVFVQQVFPMPEGAARYVWYQGTESANNELNAIGLLKPNPLGLHDMLGNAGEFVLDPSG